MRSFDRSDSRDRERRDDREDRGRRSSERRRFDERSPPRERRRSESPPARKRRNKWDIPGEGADAAQSSVAGSASGALAAALAMTNAPLAGVPVVGRKQRELYVGNLAVGIVNPFVLKEFFGAALSTAKGWNPALGPAVANIQLSGEGKFGFVEFRDEVTAATAIQMDKVELYGRPINLGRPQGYIVGAGPPPPLELPPALRPTMAASALYDPAAAFAAASSFNAPGLTALMGAAGAAGATPTAVRKQRELYVGNLPAGAVTDTDVRELFSAPLRTMRGFDESIGPPVLNVNMNSDGKFAFVEFRDDALATLALNTFDKMDLLGRSLNVGRPRGYIEPGSEAAILAMRMAVGNPLAAVNSTFSTGAVVGGMISAPPVAPPSAALRLDGLISGDMLSDAEYPDVLADIKEECEVSGKVRALGLGLG